MQRHLNYLLNDYSENNRVTFGSSFRTTAQLFVHAKTEDKPTYDMTEIEKKASKNGRNPAAVNNRRTPSGQFFQSINPTIYEKEKPPSHFRGQSITGQAMNVLYNSSSSIDLSKPPRRNLNSPSPSNVTVKFSDSMSSAGGLVIVPPASAIMDSSLRSPNPDPYTTETYGSLPHQYKPTDMRLSAPVTGISSSSYDDIPELKRNEANWLLPWQTGDRKMGKAMATAIRNRRTPTGAFADLDLAKK
eukprot:CAMPEP_0175071686 /NCGR_PEP_ID=MMETSP0052_2-20121109/19389_1 /TAXON_ID=51329 ORGANISM="Polytomella parva, Strain SAG 63-3" /NCGR_SAMPLE_ID=MMETSP0052_2 /ASSEMBLY_ACC=CAM_ASM_000194 /LENGTH=244 /DNA_ID=CAMNT_0016338901 /DNA_START=85 /DNA_END=819 /DNA_ORIENTATION=+